MDLGGRSRARVEQEQGRSVHFLRKQYKALRTDGPTDRRTDTCSYRDARTHLKSKVWMMMMIVKFAEILVRQQPPLVVDVLRLSISSMPSRSFLHMKCSFFTKALQRSIKIPSLKWKKCTPEQKPAYTQRLNQCLQDEPSTLTSCRTSHCKEGN